jgi:hypothetical protein
VADRALRQAAWSHDGAAINDHALYRSPLFGGHELDRLYSEFVLLPL